MITDGWSTYEVRLSRVYAFHIKRKMYGPRWRSDISSSFIRTGLSRSPKQNSLGNSVKSTIDDLRLQAKCQRTFHVSIHLTRAQKQTCKARKSRSSHPHSNKEAETQSSRPICPNRYSCSVTLFITLCHPPILTQHTEVTWAGMTGLGLALCREAWTHLF